MADAQFTAKPEGWKRFLRAVQDNFPGQSNAGLRKLIRETADRGGDITNLARRVALTAGGLASLRACDEALADWDGRSAQRQHDARQALA